MEMWQPQLIVLLIALYDIRKIAKFLGSMA